MRAFITIIRRFFFNYIHYFDFVINRTGILACYQEPILCWRLKQLERFAESVGTALESASQDVSQYLYDPVNAFQLVNRYNGWWAKLHELVFAETGQGK